MSSPARSTGFIVVVSSMAAFGTLVALSYNSASHSKAENGSKKKKKAKQTNHGKNTTTTHPMFPYENPQLAAIVLDLAINRAKRWMSFRITKGCSKMVGQVGGKSVSKRPLLTLEPNFVLKPVQLDHRGIREVAFYEAIQASSSKSQRQTYCRLFGPRDLKPLSIMDTFSSWTGRFQISRAEDDQDACCDEASIDKETKLLHRLELFVPEYFGMVEYVPHDKECEDSECGPYGTNYNSHILFHNLTTSFSKACVLDLKLGTETYEPDAPQEKKDRERSKYPAQTTFGFRVVAMRIYDPSHTQSSADGYVYFPKSFGRSLESRESVKAALLSFFGGDDMHTMPEEVRINRAKAIRRIMTKLKLIKGWFKDNDTFEFRASSIILIYEGDTQQSTTTTKEEEENGIQLDLGTAKMIDFGRVRRRHGGDPGYLQGVRNLISILEEIFKESFWTQEYKYIS